MEQSRHPPPHEDLHHRALTREQLYSAASSAQDALMLRRLRHSQLQNALIRHKAQRFVALKTLHRSAELRRQLSQARAAASSVEVGSTTPPPLDPSVKALIEKLTELAEITPYGHSGDQPGRSAQRAFYGGGGDPNADHQQGAEVAGYPPRAHVQNTTDGKTLPAATTATGRDAPRGLPPHEINKDGANRSGWEEREPTGSVLSATNEAEDDDDGFGGEEMDTAGGGSLGPRVPSSDEFMGATEEDDILTQQLRELDSNMSTVFQDLEKKGKKGKDSELSKKAGGAVEHLSEEEDEEKKREDDARHKERAALLVQLEGLSDGGYTRRPLWRWIAEGVDDPNPDRVLKGKQLWKAAALLVIVFFVRPKRTLMQRKARSKDRDTQDWNATLTMYFDRCQTWLLKTARFPIGNSVLKSSRLSFRLNRVDGKRDAYGAAVPGGGNAGGGFVSALVRKVARGISHESLALTLMRLKVHAKGVLNGLTQEMPPTDIMTFFSYLAADGNYFPEGFFFDEETEVLAFDELGAVRNLTPVTGPPDSLDDTLYALHTSTELEQELEADSQGHHEGFLDAHYLGWLVDAGHTLLEGTKAGIAGGNGAAAAAAAAAAATARPTDLRTAVLHGRERLPGKFKPIYRHEATSEWFDTSFVEMVLTNYLMVRVLIPWILLYPQESGLVPSRGLKPSLVMHNCQVLASTVYLIVRVLRPELTPPNADTIKAAIAEETERATRAAAAAAAGDEDGDGDGQGQDGNKNDDSSSEGGGGSERGHQAKSAAAAAPEGAEEPKPDAADGAAGKKGGTRKKLAGLRRGSRVIAAQQVVRPRTVPEIMQQKRYVSVSDKQLMPGLLPDAYFLPFAEQMRPWVLHLAAEFDCWMQRVVVEVMGKVENSAIRQREGRGAKG